MPAVKIPQTDTEEVACLKKRNGQLKQELVAVRRVGTLHRVQQLTQHVHELEDIIISMKVLSHKTPASHQIAFLEAAVTAELACVMEAIMLSS